METDAPKATVAEPGNEVEVKGQTFLVGPRYKDLILVGEGAYGLVV